MKKLTAFLLAAMTTLSLGVTAFGATDNNTENKIILGVDVNGVSATEGSVLQPSETYKFPILVTTEHGTMNLDNNMVEDYKIRLVAKEGKSAIESAKVVKGKDTPYLEISIKDGWPAEQTPVEYQIRLTKKNSNKEIISGEISFATGYSTASDEYIASLEKDEFVNIDSAAPVFTKNQLEKIAALNNYRNVTFTDETFTFETNITDMDSVNMLFNYDAIDPVINSFDTHDFMFLSFPAGPQFNRGELSIDVTNLAEDFNNNFFTYRYYKGKLNAIESEFDADNGMLTIKTGNLGRFVITDKEIPDGTILEYGFGGVDNPENNI